MIPIVYLPTGLSHMLCKVVFRYMFVAHEYLMSVDNTCSNVAHILSLRFVHTVFSGFVLRFLVIEKRARRGEAERRTANEQTGDTGEALKAPGKHNGHKNAK